MSDRVTNFILSVVVLAAFGFVLTKLLGNKPAASVVTSCPYVPYTLAPEVTTYIQTRINARKGDPGSRANLQQRLEKLEKIITDIQQSGADYSTAMSKWVAVEKLAKAHREDHDKFSLQIRKGEFYRLRNALIGQCRPKEQKKDNL